MRARFLVLAGATLLLACSGGDGQSGGDPRDVAFDEAANAEGLFGEWAHADGSEPGPDAAVSDQAGADVPDAGPDANPGDTGADAPGPEVVVPVEWDVLVLTALKGHLYLNGTFYTVVQNTSTASFVGLDGVFSRFYSLTDDGQVRVDGEPAFEVAGVPANVSFLDVAATSTPQGGYVFTLQSNGQVRNNGGAMVTLAPPGGQAWAALSAEGSTYYLATTTGTLFENGKLYPGLTLPVPAGDTLVALRVVSGQFYALTQAGKVLKNGVVLQDLAAKAAPPFVGLDVTPEHAYVLTRACNVFEDATEIAALTPFTGDYCSALAVIHSLD